jgi:hypothetical protein
VNAVEIFALAFMLGIFVGAWLVGPRRGALPRDWYLQGRPSDPPPGTDAEAGPADIVPLYHGRGRGE